MTMREVHIAIDRITRRTDIEYRKEAALHGVKLPSSVRSNEPNNVEFSKEEDSQADNYLKKRMLEQKFAKEFQRMKRGRN